MQTPQVSDRNPHQAPRPGTNQHLRHGEQSLPTGARGPDTPRSTRLASGPCDKPQFTKGFQESGAGSIGSTRGRDGEARLIRKPLVFPKVMACLTCTCRATGPRMQGAEAALAGCVCEARQKQRGVHPSCCHT